MTDRSKFFVSTEWLGAHLGDPAVAVIDASWYLPAANRDAKAEYAKAHIPGAVFFDIDAIADTTSSLPHMLPSAEKFASAVGVLGISDRDGIIVYDGAGLFSAPRVWWSFRVMGAADVKILDGGMPKWLAEGRPTTGATPIPVPKTFRARLDTAAVSALADVRRRLDDGSAQVLDARPAERFRGEVPEPRPGVKSGHMPGSISLPSSDLIEDGRLREADALGALFSGAGVDLTRPVVTSCGSGVSAAVVTLAAEMLGARDLSLYDGSWAEWGARDDTPIANKGTS